MEILEGRRDINVKLPWIPAHSEIPGKTDSDAAAKEGANSDLMDLEFPRCSSDQKIMA